MSHTKTSLLGMAFATALSPQSVDAETYKTTPSEGITPVRIGLERQNGTEITLNVGFIQNAGTDRTRPVYAFHFGESVAKKCGDFTDATLEINASQDEENIFSVETKPYPGMLEALNNERCVIVSNIAPTQE